MPLFRRGGGALLACLAEKVTRDEVERLAVARLNLVAGRRASTARRD